MSLFDPLLTSTGESILTQGSEAHGYNGMKFNLLHGQAAQKFTKEFTRNLVEYSRSVGPPEEWQELVIFVETDDSWVVSPAGRIGNGSLLSLFGLRLQRGERVSALNYSQWRSKRPEIEGAWALG